MSLDGGVVSHGSLALRPNKPDTLATGTTTSESAWILFETSEKEGWGNQWFDVSTIQIVAEIGVCKVLPILNFSFTPKC